MVTRTDCMRLGLALAAMACLAFNIATAQAHGCRPRTAGNEQNKKLWARLARWQCIILPIHTKCHSSAWGSELLSVSDLKLFKGALPAGYYCRLFAFRRAGMALSVGVNSKIWFVRIVTCHWSVLVSTGWRHPEGRSIERFYAIDAAHKVLFIPVFPPVWLRGFPAAAYAMHWIWRIFLYLQSFTAYMTTE